MSKAVEIIYLINSTSYKKQSRVRTKMRPNHGFVLPAAQISKQFLEDLAILAHLIASLGICQEGGGTIIQTL